LRYAAGEPIRARRASVWHRTVLWVRRRPAVAALLLVSGVAVLALGGATTAALYNGWLKEALQRAERFQYGRNLALAEAALRDNNMGRFEQLLLECPPAYQQQWEWRYLNQQCHADLITLTGHTAGVRSVAFSPDG